MNLAKHSIRAAALVLLPLPCILLQAAAQTVSPPANAPAPPNAADQKAFYSYVLTMEKLHKLAAVEKDLDDLQKSNPQLRQSMEADNSAADLDQAAQRLAKYPPVVAAIKKDGLTPREYVVGTIALVQAMTAVGFKKNGTYKDYPPEMRRVVSPGNLAFVEQHWDAIAKMMPAFSAAPEPATSTP